MRTYICDKCGEQVKKPKVVTIFGINFGEIYNPTWEFCDKCAKELSEEIKKIFPKKE